MRLLISTACLCSSPDSVKHTSDSFFLHFLISYFKQEPYFGVVIHEQVCSNSLYTDSDIKSKSFFFFFEIQHKMVVTYWGTSARKARSEMKGRHVYQNNDSSQVEWYVSHLETFQRFPKLSKNIIPTQCHSFSIAFIHLEFPIYIFSHQQSC